MKDNNCVFCKIVKGEIPAVKIWEDKNHIAFLDVNPINPGHVLLVPKNHEDYIFDLNDRDYNELMLKAKHVSKIMKEKLKPKRIGMAVEGFGVSHIHVHLVPVNKANELNPERAKTSSSDELKKIAERLK